MSVQTEFKNALEWETNRIVISLSWMNSSSQITASRSKWFVGSSRSRISGFTKSALAKETLILQPPESFSVGFLIISCVNPKPPRIYAALDSAKWASISWSLLLISANLALLSSSLSDLLTRTSCSVRSCSRSTSVSRTYCRGVLWLPIISCSTKRTYRWEGISKSPLAKAYSKLDLPTPFLPIKPYF